MSTGKLLLYAVLGLIALFVVSAVISAVFAAIAFIWLVIRVLAFLAVVGGLAYVAYRLYRLVSGSSSSTTERSTTGTDIGGRSATGANRVDELRRQYVNNEISEAEFERRLERELEDRETDSIDRELRRERI